jgi:hypothetical protein
VVAGQIGEAGNPGAPNEQRGGSWFHGKWVIVFSKSDRGGYAPSFSAHVRFGERGAPVQSNLALLRPWEMAPVQFPRTL